MSNGQLDVINHLHSTGVGFTESIPILFDYPEKIIEAERILKTKLEIKEFKIDEVFSIDSKYAAQKKAYEAWKENNHSPILVEDNSLFISSMNDFPGTAVSFFPKTVDQRRLICNIAKEKHDFRAYSQTILALYDGREFKTWVGIEKGIISDEPKGSNGWSWDDIFIPNEEIKKNGRTMAEMKPLEKDKVSMRSKAWKKFKDSNYSYMPAIYLLAESYKQELDRIRFNEFSKRSREFAYKLESVEKNNKPDYYFSADNYTPIYKEENQFYNRYTDNPKSPSLGLILTNIDMEKIEKAPNGEPILWQIGPRRRKLALTQRAHYFDQNQNSTVHKIIEKLEKNKVKIPPRSNKRIRAVEKALGYTNKERSSVYTPALTELGYKKISTDTIISRRQIAEFGLFNIIGKFPRKILGLGSMPPTTGWRDTLVMAALGHMISFIPRNSVFAGNTERRLRLAIEAKNTIDSLKIPEMWKNRAKRNLGASLGLDNPEAELKFARAMFKQAGIKLFRIYTIGSDRRVIETSKRLRDEFGNKIELFVGQIADKKQALALIQPNISVDGLIFGHGGGQQCTSAVNGMAITTLEDIYEITRDPLFNKTSLIVEGGIDRSLGIALLLGIDCCLANQKVVRGTIETGGYFIRSLKGRIGQPYPGSASPVTQIIESENIEIRAKRTDPSGRIYSAEGKPGLMYYEKKANSMSFWINENLAYAARCLADLGVQNISELRTLLKTDDKEFLRIMSEKTQYLSDAYGNFNN